MIPQVLVDDAGPDVGYFGPLGVYDDYLRELAKTHPEDLAVLAVSLIGPRNQVAKLVRHLDLLS